MLRNRRSNPAGISDRMSPERAIESVRNTHAPPPAPPSQSYVEETREHPSLGTRVENHICIGRRATNDQLAEDAIRHLTQCHVAHLDCPAQHPDQCADELHPVVGDQLRVAHRVAHATRDRGVTSEVEGGSRALTPFDLARNAPDLNILDAFKSRWGRQPSSPRIPHCLPSMSLCRY
jgi:hypothetical protein